MFEKLYINTFSFYKPAPDSPKDAPKLEYVDSLFKRRLSQLSRMTIEVVHNVQESAPEAKIIFASYRGEIARQVRINRGLVDDEAILPAQFSLSVFNTPPAVATIALGIKNGYTAVYPARHCFYDAFVAAATPVLSGREKQTVFVYGDELIPDEYKEILSAEEKAFFPFAFAAVLSSQKTPRSVSVPDGIAAFTAEQFLSYLLQKGGTQ